MALRKYRKRTGDTNTGASRPLSAAAKAKPREQGADAVAPAPLPQAANAAPLETSTPPPAPAQASPSSPAQSPPSPPDQMSLKDQLDVLRRAGQQQQAEPSGAAAPHSFASTPLEAQLDAIPHLSVAQRAFLRSRPYALARPDVLSWGHNFALHYGLPVDSPAYFQVLDEALHQYGNLAFTTPPTASPATETASAPTPQPTPAPMPQAPQPPASDRDDDFVPQFVSAPPSRSEYAGSAPPPDVAAGRVTLSAEERQIAAATGCSELDYARNKLKLQAMKKQGLIRD